MELFLSDKVALWPGDCLEVLAGFEAESFDSCVTDPPYHLQSIHKRFAAKGRDETSERYAAGAYGRHAKGFMGKQWDGGDVAFRTELWAQVLRVLKPGGHLIAFGGTRTYHRMACAIEDASFEIRDQIGWAYGSGFPKSHNVANSIDKLHGASDRGHRIARASAHHPDGTKEPSGDHLPAYKARTEQGKGWDGFGTALKPAWEPIVLARKPLIGTVAENVLKHGTGALNIDGCRVGDDVRHAAFTSFAPCHGNQLGAAGTQEARRGTQGDPKEYVGRWPANLVHDGSDEVMAAFPDTAPASAGKPRAGQNGDGWGMTATGAEYEDSGGSAARFFYTAKADADDRLGSKHPTVKPLDLMQWLVRLVTPPGGTVLDPFAGTGTTGEAAWREGCKAVLIEREPEYQADVRRRLAYALAGPDERRAAGVKAAGKIEDAGPLFTSR